MLHIQDIHYDGYEVSILSQYKMEALHPYNLIFKLSWLRSYACFFWGKWAVRVEPAED